MCILDELCVPVRVYMRTYVRYVRSTMYLGVRTYIA